MLRCKYSSKHPSLARTFRAHTYVTYVILTSNWRRGAWDSSNRVCNFFLFPNDSSQPRSFPRKKRIFRAINYVTIHILHGILFFSVEKRVVTILVWWQYCCRWKGLRIWSNRSMYHNDCSPFWSIPPPSRRKPLLPNVKAWRWHEATIEWLFHHWRTCHCSSERVDNGTPWGMPVLIKITNTSS